MARYTFTCEHFDYNDFNGDENGVASKHTTQFRADTIDTMLENFEMFLRGAGFNFDGTVDIVSEDEDDEDAQRGDAQRGHRVFDSMVNSLIRDDNSINIIAGSNDWDGQHSFSFDNMAAAQPTYTVNTDIEPNTVSLDSFDISSLTNDYIVSIDSSQIPTLSTENIQYSVEFPESEYCSVCRLPKDVMTIHKCYDEKCPIKVTQ